MKKLFIIGMILWSGAGYAQDLFQESLYSANLVFQNSFAISLTDQQADKIKKIHSQSSVEFRRIKWDLDEASAKLKKILNETKPNPEAASKQLDIVLSLENSLKKKQLSTLVAIKNELNETQQRELQELKGVSNVQQYDITNKSLTIGPTTIINDTERKTTTEVNTNPNVKLRLSTGSENSPLMLISTKDGMVQVDNFDKINHEDIQSLEVLKDKWITDKYGEKAKNGIIIITLKKDKQEEFEH